jgi:molybdenum cofactor cytidylyltransferase
MLQHVLHTVLHNRDAPVVLVLGSGASLYLRELDEERIFLAINTEWERGMATSIKAGLKALLDKLPDIESVIIMTCDQPYISGRVLDELVETQMNTGKPIVASSYGDTLGPPAIFSNKYFPQLLQLEGDTGARKIIMQHPEEVASVSFPEGNIDIDTQADYDALLKSNHTGTK